MSRSDLLQDACRMANAFLDEVPDRRVRPDCTLQSMREALAEPLSANGVDAGEVLAELNSAAQDGLMASTGPRFFGFVIGGALPVSIAADWLAVAWDQNPGIYVLSPAEAVAEETVAGWILDLLRLPPESSVGFVTGGQMANFTTLAAARYEVLRRVGWDVNENGLPGAPAVHLVNSQESHVTVFRSLRYLGLGTSSVITVETDDQGRMIPARLRETLQSIDGPLIVCAQAGNVNSGACDPLDEIADIVHEKNGWLHVDGAFGLWAAVVPSRRHLVAGAEKADSWAVDAHKWLNVPQDCGFAIVRDRAAHRSAVSTNAEYLIKSDGEERDAVDWVPEFSRRSRGFAVYAALRSLGRNGVTELVERCCQLAKRMATKLTESPHVHLLNDVVLNQALLRFVPPEGDADEFTRRVILAIQKDGTTWLGGTTWRGEAAMRVSVSNWSTTAADIDRSAEAILRCLDQELNSLAETAGTAAGNSLR
ncbi:MAG: aminotransferase class V-fold PLP-dependent enzyme [Acidobacteriota bacterium]